MSDKFQNKYRIPSARAEWWNYGWNAAYFITICTAHREHLFGEIINPNGNDNDDDANVETGQCPVSTNAIIKPTTNPITEQKTPGQLRFRNQGKETASSIIGSYKSIVTKYAHRMNRDFEWQERFHDHIIRDEQEFERIAAYIRNNPFNWKNDKFYN